MDKVEFDAEELPPVTVMGHEVTVHPRFSAWRDVHLGLSREPVLEWSSRLEYANDTSSDGYQLTHTFGPGHNLWVRVEDEAEVERALVRLQELVDVANYRLSRWSSGPRRSGTSAAPLP